MLLSEVGIGSRTVKALEKKNIVTVNDMVRLVPRKYKDYLTVVSLMEATVDADNAIKGHLVGWEERGDRPKCIVAKILDEETETIFQVSWFGNYYIKNYLSEIDGENVIVCGKLKFHPNYGYQMSEPDIFDLESNFHPHIMAIYKKFKGISEKTIKTSIYTCLKHVEEPLEKEVFPDLLSYKEALYKLHYPKCMDDIEQGTKRLLFQDLLYFSMQLQSNQTKKPDGPVFPNCTMSQDFVKTLPFPLTEDQKEVCNKILLHTKKGERCNLLVQGDVGCGKTVVAFVSIVNAFENGFQSVLVAPTQVLAEQHYLELTERMQGIPVKIAFLSSGLKAAEKRKIIKGIADGEYQIVVGTHSVFSKDVEYNNLGLIVTDEEHKFGVAQKEALMEKASSGIHVISMSATPIPRSLAGIYFGDDKEICAIRSMPNGRIPIQTATQVTHKNVFSFMEQQINEGRQCYVVCPAIVSKTGGDDDDKPKVTIKNIEDVKKEYESYFAPKGIKIGTVHGKMTKTDISNSIDAFTNNEVQILMSTTVIEVGVNVPNSTVMVIEQADRFGLASLHQLRGRVGRNSYKSYCILVSDDKNNERLKTMCETTSGFDIAEKDLELRGGGDLIGTAQSGFDRYIEMILENPEYYDEIKKVASDCINKGLGKTLQSLYAKED